MPLPNENQLLNLETYILRVHVNCDGCRQKVKKTLRKIEGVYSVNVDVEEQIVTVTGNVDSARLIQKLAKSGKHAKLWSPPMSNPDGIEDSDRPGNDRSRQMHHHNPSFHAGEDEDDTEWWFERYKNQLLNGEQGWNSETDPGQFEEEDHVLDESDTAPKIGIQGYDQNRHGYHVGLASNRIRMPRDFPAHLYQQYYPASASSMMPDSSGYQRYHSDGSWMNDSYSFRNINNNNPTWAGQIVHPMHASSYGYY